MIRPLFVGGFERSGEIGKKRGEAFLKMHRVGVEFQKIAVPGMSQELNKLLLSDAQNFRLVAEKNPRMIGEVERLQQLWNPVTMLTKALLICSNAQFCIAGFGFRTHKNPTRL